MKNTMNVRQKWLENLSEEYPIMDEAAEIGYAIISLTSFRMSSTDESIEREFKNLEDKMLNLQNKIRQS